MKVPVPPRPAHPFVAQANESPFLSGNDLFPLPPQKQASSTSAELRSHTLEPLGLFFRDDRPVEPFINAQSGVTLEIAISWGSTVICVEHLSPPRSFFIGEEAMPETGATGDPRVDFVLPEEALGRKNLPLVLVNGSDIQLVMVDIARGSLMKGEESFDLSELLQSSSLCPTVTRAKQLTLQPGARVHLKIRELEFHISLVKKATSMKRGLASGWDTTAPSYFLATLVMAASLFASIAYFVPPIGITDEGALNKGHLVLIAQYLDAASEREQKMEETSQSDEQASQDSGATGQKAQDEEGAAGKRDTEVRSKRVAVQGPRDNPQLQLSRNEAIQLAQEFGMIGLLSSSISSDPNMPSSVFGRDFALGSDDVSANGNFFGDTLGESGGFGGLGMSNAGFGGGDLLGKGIGIGLGRIGTIGPGQGQEGWGTGRDVGGKGHTVSTPSMRPGTTTVSGRLPPQVIQRVVRQNFGRFRMCYSQALGRNPNLEGRIPVRFVIGRDGAVSNVSATGDFPDASVRSCVQSAFYGVSFPPPEGGIVTVTYPLIFSPN